MSDNLMDEDGENRAVRWFLAGYKATPSNTVDDMKKHLTRCGFPLWPDWCAQSHGGQHLTKGGAQSWLRHLFALEPTKEQA